MSSDIYKTILDKIAHNSVPQYSFFYQLPKTFPFLLPGLAILVAFSFLYGLIILILKLRYLYKQTKRNDVLLEIRPPRITQQSAFTTEQLFTTFHSIGTHLSFLDAKAKRKKTYSLELVSTKKEGIRYIIRTNSLDADVIKKNLTAYMPRISIREVKEYLPQSTDLQESTLSWDILEFNQAGHFALPLQIQSTLEEYDPIAYISGHMTKLLDPELVTFQIVLAPLLEATHPEESESLDTLEEMIENDVDITSNLVVRKRGLFFVILFMPLQILINIISALIFTPIKFFLPSSIPAPSTLTSKQRQIQQVVESKINQQLFETSIRVLIVQKSRRDYVARARGFVSSFVAFNNGNYQGLFLPHGIFSFLKQKSIFKRFRYFKLRNRLLSFSNNPILSVSELSSLYHFPYSSTTQTEDMIKVMSSELPAPLSLKNKSSLDVTFGMNTYASKEVEIGLTDEERSRHVYLIGQTGSGKSTVMFHMAKDDIRRGRGVAVVDPHGDLIEDLLITVPEKRVNDFIYLNPFDLKHPIGINLLELPDGIDEDELELEKEVVTEGVISIFRRVFSNEEQGNAHRIEYILRNAIYTSFYVEDRTIFTIYSLLNDSNFRKQVIAKVDDEDLLNFWKNEFNKAGNYQIIKMVSGVTAKVGRFLFSPTAKRILGQTKSTINFDDILEDSKILLCNLSEGKIGEDTSQLLGTTVITKLQQAAYRRARKDKRERKPFYLFIDEFQNFATSSFTKLLSGGRKFGIRVTIAEQSTAQQKDKDVTSVILANTGTVICFKTASPEDEKLLLPQFSPYVAKGELMNLPRYHFYIKLGALEPEEPFSGVTYPMETDEDKVLINKLIASSQNKYATVYVKKEKQKVVQVKKPIEKKVKVVPVTVVRSGLPSSKKK